MLEFCKDLLTLVCMGIVFACVFIIFYALI